MKHNLLKSVILSVILLMGVSNVWAWNFTSGVTIYFDNSSTQWNSIYLRVGTKNWSNAYPITEKVSGTSNLYKFTLPVCNDYEAFAFSNGAGWTGSNNTNYTIYQPSDFKPTGFPITGLTEYFKFDLNHSIIFTPKNYTYNSDENCKYYSTLQKHYVNYITSPGGSVTVTYTDEDGNSYSKKLDSSTPLIVHKTCSLKFSVEANDGYTFKNIYIRNDKNNYTTIADGGTITISKDIIVIPEFTSNTEKKTIFLDLSTPLPTDNTTWTKNDAIFYANDGTNNTLTLFNNNHDDLYYHAAKQFPVGKVVIFKRVDPQNTNTVWNECATIVPATPTNKFRITDWTQSGVWEAGPTREVKIDPCLYGTYGIKLPYENEFRNCINSDDLYDAVETVNVPYGTEIEIKDVVISPEYTSHYTQNPRYKYSVAVQVLTSGNPFYELTELKYTVTENMYVCPNIVMAQPHTVYLHIPKEFIGDWNSNDANFKWNTMYLYDYLSEGQIIDEDNDDKRVAHLLTAKKDEDLSANGDEYWRFDVPAGYHTFVIERKNNNNDDNTGEGGKENNSYLCSATPKFYFRSPLDEKNCFSLTGSGWIGEWREINRNYTVELGYCEFGEYKVMCNGNIYTSTTDHNVSFEAPYGSEITFVEGTPLQDIYKGGWMLREFNGAEQKTRLDATKPYYVTGDILLDDNFVTRNERVFYFAVPTTKNSDTQWDNAVDKWNKPNAEYYIWTYDDVRDFPMYESTCHGTPVESYNGNGYKYYKFTLSAERNAFRFEHKLPSQDTNNQNPTLGRTFTLKFEVPTTEKNCYYLTGEYTTINGIDYYNGYWDILPIDDDQYRLLYVEQVVEKDDENNTILTRKKAHPSDIFTKEDITTYTNKDGETLAGKLLSLHVYRDRPYTGISWYDEEGKNHKYYTTKASNAGVILQKTEGGKWVDVSNNMVFGPLEAVPELALLPGRKNAASSYSSANITNLYYDDGIDSIKNDDHPDQGNGVWNFVVKKDNSGNVYIALNETHRYEGEYYIRTLATANGGWENYTNHKMTRSDISKVHSNYSHYFCKWIKKNTDVQFTIANNYGCAISDTLISDRTDLRGERTSEAEKIVRGITLPKDANIRFSWNEKTNFIHRAYLGGSTHVYERFLVLTGKEGDNTLFGLDGQQLPEGQDNGSDPRYGLNTNEEIFNDISNWVYYADVNMIPRAQVKLTADLQWEEGTENIEVVQHFIGSSDAYCDTILKGSGSQQYRVRMLYDFKTNEIISAYVPGGNTYIEPIETNLMLVREENNPASQMDFETNNMKDEGKRSYGVLELTRSSLIDNYTDDDYYRVSLYWISFPFDVAIKDIFGFGTYGKHWLIQSYNGEKRAKNGLWADSDTNWEYHSNPNSLNAGTQYEGIMKKGVGYVVALNRKRIIGDSLFLGRIDRIALYFPATTTIQDHIDKGQSENIDVPEHVCTINRPTQQGNRTKRDSDWNVIGVPSYADPISSLLYYYRWDGQYDAYTLMSSANGDAFKTMNAYMVQYAGTLNWSNVVEERSAIAAKRNTDDNKKHHLRIELQQNGEIKDYTYITMQDEDVTTGFDFNFDLCKIINKGSNIYSIITNEESPVEVAANVLPIEETIIPLGVVTTTAGEYTFAMPNGTDGIVVELIDYETNTRTNMLLDNYTVNLGKGTFENRFALHVKPNKTTTSIVDVNTNSNGVRKFIIDGVLYMQKDGVLYDAQGRCVQ